MMTIMQFREALCSDSVCADRVRQPTSIGALSRTEICKTESHCAHFLRLFSHRNSVRPSVTQVDHQRP